MAADEFVVDQDATISATEQNIQEDIEANADALVDNHREGSDRNYAMSLSDNAADVDEEGNFIGKGPEPARKNLEDHIIRHEEPPVLPRLSTQIDFVMLLGYVILISSKNGDRGTGSSLFLRRSITS